MKLVVAKHCPAIGSGTKVYMADVWLLTVAGLHDPVRPLVEVVGNEGTALPAQMIRDVPKLNVGTLFGVTVTV